MNSELPSEDQARNGSLAGQHVCVTGAGRGIGEAIAVAASDAGAAVSCLDRDQPSVDRVVAAIAASGGRAVSAVVDLTSGDALRTAVDSVEAALGPITVVAANAGGAAGSGQPVLEMTDADWGSMFERNVTTAFNTAGEFGRRLAARGNGAMVFTTSFTDEIAPPGLVHYSAAKAAVRQLVRGLALELGPHGIRVNAVAPGFVLTDGNRSILGDPVKSAPITDRVPLGRLGSPDEIARAVVFLASSDAAYITGVTLPVDGGWRVRK